MSFFSSCYTPPRLDGTWAGHHCRIDSGMRDPLHLVLVFRDGLITGSGNGPGGSVDVFGLYGAESNQCVLLLTSTTGWATSLEGQVSAGGISGSSSDERGTSGRFEIWPLPVPNPD
jgi:hypothetical protein